jgi:hypothetical protein
MLEEKLDTLTKEIVALRQAIEANGTGGGAATETTTTKKATAKKPAKVEPEHDADEVGSAMRKAAKLNKPVVLAYLKKQKCADLAELLTKPDLFDAAFDFAGTVEAPEAEDEDDDV